MAQEKTRGVDIRVLAFLMFTTLPEFWPLRPLLTLGIGRDLQVSSDPQKVTVSAAFALCGSQHVPSAPENSRAKNCIS
jgi:hypothetical protein